MFHKNVWIRSVQKMSKMKIISWGQFYGTMSHTILCFSNKFLCKIVNVMNNNLWLIAEGEILLHGDHAILVEVHGAEEGINFLLSLSSRKVNANQVKNRVGHLKVNKTSWTRSDIFGIFSWTMIFLRNSVKLQSPAVSVTLLFSCKTSALNSRIWLTQWQSFNFLN